MAVKIWDPGKVKVVVGGIILEDFASNDIVTVQYEIDRYSKSTPMKGHSVYSRHTNRGGLCSISVLSNSKSMDLMYTAIDTLDQVDLPFTITILDDNEDSQNVVLYGCMFKSIPAYVKASEVSMCTVDIYFDHSIVQFISNLF